MLKVQPLVLPAVSGVLTQLGGAITYWSVRDTTASTGSVLRLYDGASTDGQLLIDAATSAGQSTSEYIHRGHLRFQGGLYFDLVSGSVEGSVTVWLGLSDWDWHELLTVLPAGE